MSDPPPADILILAGEEAIARRWAEILTGPETRVWLALHELPRRDQLDLIVTDRSLTDRPETGAPSQEPFGEADGGGPGVIRIGGGGPADVHLPADATERELQLACRLLSQIVRLRRQGRKHARTHRQLARQALTDPLTGLPNRRAWDQALGQRLAAAGDLPGRLCVAIFDLDHFKQVNDSHGHAVGDEVLRAAGRVISGSLRVDDFVARLGGDEFGLLLSLPNRATAAALVERVRSGLPAGLARSATHVVTASAGFCLAPSGKGPAPLPSPDSLFVAADTALRKAKRQGRDRTVGSAPK